jgi:hypothetical protein
MIKYRAKSLQDGAIGLTQYYDIPDPPLDSLKKYESKIRGFHFIYHKGAYEALKSTGIDKITNDSLRIKLMNLYDFILPRIESLLSVSQYEMQNWSDHMSVIADQTLIRDSSGLKKFTYSPKNIFNNPDAAKVLDRYEYIAVEGIGRIESALDHSIAVLQLLEKELSND